MRRHFQPWLRAAVIFAAALPLAAATFPSAGSPRTGNGVAERADTATTTIIVVRHAEAGAGDPRNPALTAAGEARAHALHKAVANAGIVAAYASEYRRTQQTAEIATGLTATAVPASAMNGNGQMKSGSAASPFEAAASALLDRIMREHAGSTVLVAGHSNTVPVFVKQATGVTVDPIADTEYDRLFIITIRGGTSRVIQARY